MDFVGKRHWYFLVSLIVILPGVAFLIIAPGLKPGIDFTGGSTVTVEFADDVRQEDLRSAVADLGHPDASVQKLETNTYFFRTKELKEEDKEILVDALEARLSPNGAQVLSFDLVSPVVAQETVLNALWAVLLAAVGIFLYIWWAFRTFPGLSDTARPRSSRCYTTR